MGNISDYFESTAYQPEYHIGDRITGKWNKIPFMGTVGNDLHARIPGTIRSDACGMIRRGVLIVPIATALQRLVPRRYLEGQSIALKVGQVFALEQERRRLDDAGYQLVDTVTIRGEYAVRGSIMDIFPMGLEWPIRIDLFDNEIESLRGPQD